MMEEHIVPRSQLAIYLTPQASLHARPVQWIVLSLVSPDGRSLPRIC